MIPPQICFIIALAVAAAAIIVVAHRRCPEAFTIGAPHPMLPPEPHAPAPRVDPAPAYGAPPDMLAVPDAGMDAAALRAMSPPELLHAAQTNDVGV